METTTHTVTTKSEAELPVVILKKTAVKNIRKRPPTEAEVHKDIQELHKEVLSMEKERMPWGKKI